MVLLGWCQESSHGLNSIHHIKSLYPEGHTFVVWSWLSGLCHIQPEKWMENLYHLSECRVEMCSPMFSQIWSNPKCKAMLRHREKMHYWGHCFCMTGMVTWFHCGITVLGALGFPSIFPSNACMHPLSRTNNFSMLSRLCLFFITNAALYDKATKTILLSSLLALS